MIVTETIYNTPESWDARAKEPLSWQAALWSKEGQEARFHAIRRHVSMLPGDTLLDFGCGTGRLADFIPASVGYCGHDWSPEMRLRARREGRNVLDDLGSAPGSYAKFDHVIACGTFNLAHEWSKDDTGMAMLDLWTRHTRRTLAVCLYAGHDPSCLTYNPVEALMWARTFSKKVLVDTTYLPNDFLLVMHR